MDYASHLKSTAQAAMLDRKTFGAWERGQISMTACFRQYKAHNGIEDIKFDLEDFWSFLDSLGYKRGEVMHRGKKYIWFNEGVYEAAQDR